MTPDAREIMAKLLRRVGVVVTTAASATAALEILAKVPGETDVLISDIGMPDQDGYDRIRQVRARTHGRAGHPHLRPL